VQVTVRRVVVRLASSYPFQELFLAIYRRLREMKPLRCKTKIWIRYQTLDSDADSSGLDDWGRNRPSRPHTFSNGP
jgi:hypothetical protein